MFDKWINKLVKQLEKGSLVNVAEQIVHILEKRQVKYIFGIPGEENVNLIDAIDRSSQIKFTLVRHEQGASFMADVYRRLTGQPGITVATLGSGAINLLLGVSTRDHCTRWPEPNIQVTSSDRFESNV